MLISTVTSRRLRAFGIEWMNFPLWFLTVDPVSSLIRHYSPSPLSLGVQQVRPLFVSCLHFHLTCPYIPSHTCFCRATVGAKRVDGGSLAADKEHILIQTLVCLKPETETATPELCLKWTKQESGVTFNCVFGFIWYPLTHQPGSVA